MPTGGQETAIGAELNHARALVAVVADDPAALAAGSHFPEADRWAIPDESQLLVVGAKLIAGIAVAATTPGALHRRLPAPGIPEKDGSVPAGACHPVAAMIEDDLRRF